MTVQSRQLLQLPGATVEFSVSAHSDRGAVRAINEDSFRASAPFFMVADGMGGHAFGDRASQAAADAFAAAIEAGSPTRPDLVLEAIAAANDAVLALPGDALSGTTLTGIAFVELGPAGSHHWMAFNVGDSRTYSWDGRTLRQLTVDHSAVQELVDRGEITRAEADRHPLRNVVTRALGASADVEPDIWVLPTRARQMFLICSDGLTKEIGDDEIARIIVFHDSQSLREGAARATSLAERLVNAAIAAGGSDNVTVVVVESTLTGGSAGDHDGDTIEREHLTGQLEDTRPRG